MTKSSPRPVFSSETDLIRRYFAPLATHPDALSLNDDAALFIPQNKAHYIITKDMALSGVHFFPDDPPDLIAKKAFRRNISDVIAKGALPERYFLALALDDSVSEGWISEFARGLKEDQEHFDCSLMGGDTSRAPSGSMISITMIGRKQALGVLARDGARAGDRLFISGCLGDAALGLLLRQKDARLKPLCVSNKTTTHLLQSYLVPHPPPVQLASLLARNASASLDISDGLLMDLMRLLKASGVSAVIDRTCLPLSWAASELLELDVSLWSVILAGGDDYQMLVCIPEKKVKAFENAAKQVNIEISEIGFIAEGDPKITLTEPTHTGAFKQRIIHEPPGFEHFSSK